MRSVFTGLFGNENTARRISSAILSGALPHAMLIVGPRGSGKHTLAREIAAAANCERRDEGDYPLPCRTCNRCHRIYNGNFPDISILSRESGKATIGVEQMREFRSDMFLSATEADCKFYIIEDADLLTPAAQNSLLKVLEEPPSGVHILLLAAEADKILSTIKSRAQLVQTELFPRDRLRGYVCRLSDTAKSLAAHEPDTLDGIILASGGVIGQALEYLDDRSSGEVGSRREAVMSIISVLPKKTPFSALYSKITSLPEKRGELRSVLELFVTALSDMIKFKVEKSADMLFFLSEDAASEASEGLGIKRLTAIYDIIISAISDIDKNVLTAPLLTDIAVKIKEC